MNARWYVVVALLLGVTTGTVWSAARALNGPPSSAFSPSVDDWLEVSLNAKFARYYSKVWFRFEVWPSSKKIMMLWHAPHAGPEPYAMPGTFKRDSDLVWQTNELVAMRADAERWAATFGYVSLESRECP